MFYRKMTETGDTILEGSFPDGVAVTVAELLARAETTKVTVTYDDGTETEYALLPPADAHNMEGR